MDVKFGFGSKARIFRIGQRKSDPSRKVIYRLNRTRTGWDLVLVGDLDDVKAFLIKQKKYAEAAEFRSVVADMCGTSYRAANPPSLLTTC